MTTAAPTIASPTASFHLVPLAQLHESPHNTRRHTDAKALEELTASIKSHGVLTPLLVRPNAKGYEIAAGHRRYRAAKAAGLTEVPAIVRGMTDQEFLEVLTIENLQREDIHPLDEAQGYQALLRIKGYDVARIAERVGRSVKYVYDRIKLLNLTKEAQSLFLGDKITAGHAILLARLTKEEQAGLIEPGKGGLWQAQRDFLHHPEEDWEARREADPYADLKPVSVRELEAYLAKHVRFDADQVDPVLFPETVDTLQAAQEQEEKIVKITYEHFVQPSARAEERTYCVSSWKRADGRDDSKPCDRAVTGVIVVGYGRGEAFRVCIDKKRCTVHWGKEIRAAKKRQAGKADEETAAEQLSWKQQQERLEAERRQDEAARARWKKAQPAILRALAERVQSLPLTPGGLLATTVLTRCAQWEAKRAAKRADEYVPAPKTAEDLLRRAAFLILSAESDGWMGFRDFPRRAKAFGLDVQKILDEVAPEQPAETKPAKKGKRAS